MRSDTGYIHKPKPTGKRVQIGGGYVLHFSGHQVWLNTEVADYDGLCIGSGETRTEALTNARDTLNEALGGLLTFGD